MGCSVQALDACGYGFVQVVADIPLLAGMAPLSEEALQAERDRRRLRKQDAALSQELVEGFTQVRMRISLVHAQACAWCERMGCLTDAS